MCFIKMKLIIRADDFGFSEGVNYGELAVLKTGLVKSIGLMVNMPGTKQALHIINKFPEVCLGLHANLVVGRPSADPSIVGSLLQENGDFITSKTYRRLLKEGKEVFTDEAAVRIEVEAQIDRFYQLTGKLPEYIDTHAVHSDHLYSVVRELAKEYNMIFLATDPKFSANLSTNPIRLSSSANFYQQGGNPDNYINLIGNELVKNKFSYIVIHPGYLDDIVMAKSSFTQIRTHDVAMIKSKNTKKWFEDHQVQLLSHRALKEVK